MSVCIVLQPTVHFSYDLDVQRLCKSHMAVGALRVARIQAMCIPSHGPHHS